MAQRLNLHFDGLPKLNYHKSLLQIELLNIGTKNLQIVSFLLLGYNLLLAILCSYQAFRIRKLPGQFNDSRGICFTMITCALILFMFLAAFFAIEGKPKSIIFCFAFVVTGFAGLVCMFLPKVYIVLLKPERNVRQSTMRVKGSESRSTVGGSINKDSTKGNQVRHEISDAN